MLVTYSTLLGLVASLVWAVARLATLLPEYQSQFDDLIDQASTWVNGLGITDAQISSAVGSLDPNALVGVAQSVLSGTTGFLSNTVFLLTLLLFLILEGVSFPQRLALAGTQRPDLVQALHGFAHAVRQYMWSSTVFGVIVGLIDVAVLVWLDVPLPWLWGLLAFITNYITNVGFVIGLVPPALLALLDEGAQQALVVVLAFSVINVVFQSFIQPKVVGDSVGLSVSLTFISLMFWSFVLGPLGAVLAVPLTLFVKALLIDADPDAKWLKPLIAPGESQRE